MRREPTYLKPGGASHEERPEEELEATRCTNSSQMPPPERQGKPQVETVRGLTTPEKGSSWEWVGQQVCPAQGLIKARFYSSTQILKGVADTTARAWGGNRREGCR